MADVNTYFIILSKKDSQSRAARRQVISTDVSGSLDLDRRSSSVVRVLSPIHHGPSAIPSGHHTLDLHPSISDSGADHL
jgi:hypothetical protein